MTQARATQAPPAPAAPAAPAVAGLQGTNVVTPAMLTARDVAALRVRGSELSRQLNSAVGRRNEVQGSLRSATGADRAGLEQRLGVLDTRIARLEGDIAENGNQLSSLPASLTGQPQFPPFSPRNSGGDKMVPIGIVFTLFVLAPLAVSIARMVWRRGSLPRHSPPSADNTQRLERMEQAIDSIAIEIERVSEGQRFVTRLMSERQNAALEPAKPISVPAGEKLGTPR